MTAPDTLWSFCPSLGAAIAMTVFLLCTSIAHIVQGIHYRKPYTWVICMSALLQTSTYILRILSILHPTSFGAYAGWFVLILVSPLWTNAFVYMILGRMVYNYMPSSKIFNVTAWRIGQLFVGLDIVAFVVQVFGAGSTQSGGADETSAQVLRGLHIYMAGVGAQQTFILIFLFFAVNLHRHILQQQQQEKQHATPSPHPPHLTRFRPALTLLYAIYVVLGLITVSESVLSSLSSFTFSLSFSQSTHPPQPHH